MNKKYTAYSWEADDEGGIGVCKFGEFSPNLGYDPESGWRARPSEKIKNFSTMEELIQIVFNYMNLADLDDAKWWAEAIMESYEEDLE